MPTVLPLVSEHRFAMASRLLSLHSGIDAIRRTPVERYPAVSEEPTIALPDQSVGIGASVVGTYVGDDNEKGPCCGQVPAG